MVPNQIKLLKDLAKEIKAEKKSKSESVATLQSAKIITRQRNFTGKFSNLRRLSESAK